MLSSSSPARRTIHSQDTGVPARSILSTPRRNPKCPLLLLIENSFFGRSRRKPPLIPKIVQTGLLKSRSMWARPQSAPCQVVAGSPLQPPMVLFHPLGSRWINPLHRGKEAKIGREKRKCLPTSLSSGRGGVGVKEGQSRMYSPSSRPYLAQSRRTPIWRLRLRQLPFGEKEGTRPRNSASFCTFACSEWERGGTVS